MKDFQELKIVTNNPSWDVFLDYLEDELKKVNEALYDLEGIPMAREQGKAKLIQELKKLKTRVNRNVQNG